MNRISALTRGLRVVLLGGIEGLQPFAFSEAVLALLSRFFAILIPVLRALGRV